MKTNEALKNAFAKGYRVCADGAVVNKFGILRKLSIKKSHGSYLRFNINHEGEAYPVFVHKLQAFQKFGEQMFEPGIMVRHHDGDSFNNRKENILLGTPRDNAMDRDPEDRKAHAFKARSFRGTKLSPEILSQINLDHAAGLGYNRLEAKYGFGKSTLSYHLSASAKRRKLIQLSIG